MAFRTAVKMVDAVVLIAVQIPVKKPEMAFHTVSDFVLMAS